MSPMIADFQGVQARRALKIRAIRAHLRHLRIK
jgi:hypothetical protein